MKRFSKTLIALCVVVILCACFSGCQSTKWGPVGTTDPNGEVTNNGSMVVQQGNYLYYVNGMDDVATLTEPKKNYFGKASVKGSIMKSKINEDGTLSDTAIVVPKMMMTKNSNGGLYIFGEWIYYTSPSTRTDNEGKVQTSNLDYMRTKTDGTKTQTIATIKGDSTQYYITADTLVYYADGKLHKVTWTNKKVNSAVEMATDITGVLMSRNQDVVFFTKALEKDSEISKKHSNNELYVATSKMDATKIISYDTFATTPQAPTLKEEKTVTPLKYDDQRKTLYLSAKNGDNAGEECTYGVVLGENYSFDKTKMVKFANSKLEATFIPQGIDKGLFVPSATAFEIYSPMNDSDVVEVKKELAKISAAATILFFETIAEKEYVYYSINNNVYRLNLTDADSFEEKVFEETISTSWLGVAKIGKFIYYINTTGYNYLYRFDYTQFILSDNNRVFPKAEIVSGYEVSDKTKDGKVPKFMTAEDKKNYLDANKPEETK